MIVGLGSMYLLGFAMSFDAPGSISDPKAWGMRFLIFSPILVMIVTLIFAVIAYSSRNYKRSVIIGLMPVGIFVLMIAFMTISSFTSMAKYRAQMTREAEDARLYPVQKFLRHVEGGTDTIIVFPNRIVAYRKYQGSDMPWGGPLGDLNNSRDTLDFNRSSDTKIKAEDLSQFIDDQGRIFSEVYFIR